MATLLERLERSPERIPDRTGDEIRASDRCTALRARPRFAIVDLVPRLVNRPVVPALRVAAEPW
jgi:hypothetical protein